MTALQRSAFLAEFQCTGDACPDTCCKGWGMQLTKETVDKYKAEAPELLDAVTTGEAEYIMKRDPETDYCVKFDKGWCGVHASKGTDFLGDACHFFPRVTRQAGDTTFMTASLSCPEVVKLSLLNDNAFTLEESDIERVPFSLKEYGAEGLPADKVMEVHRLFVDAAIDENFTAAHNLIRISSVARSMQRVDAASWAMAVPFYFKQVDSSLPVAEEKPEDPFNLVNALQGLIGASKKTRRPRLDKTLEVMAEGLEVQLNWEALSIKTSDDSWPAFVAMRDAWLGGVHEHYDTALKRWIQAQLAVALFPFAGLGHTLEDRITILGVRFATVQLALMCAHTVKSDVLDEEEMTLFIQSLARFMDHLADPTLSLSIYEETGWAREARLRALVMDCYSHSK